MRNLSTLAFRNLWVRRARTVSTAFGITLGVAVAVAMLIANESTLQSLLNLFSKMSSRASVVVQGIGNTTFSQSALKEIQAFPGVKVAAPIVYRRSMFLWKNNRIRVWLAGIDPEADPGLRTYTLSSGRFLDAQSRSYAIVVVREAAQRYGIAVGDQIGVVVANGEEMFEVVGILENEGAGQIEFGNIGFISLRVAREVLNLGNEVDQIDVVAEAEIANSSPALEKFKNDLQAALSDRYVVTYPSSGGQELVTALSNFRMSLSMFAAVALFMGALLIYNTFAMNALERTREHGLLRALGCSRWQLFRLNLGEALFMGVLASLAGLGAGLLLAFPLTVYMTRSVFSWQQPAIVVQPLALAIGFAIGVGVTVVAALRPAWTASRISPVEALRIRGAGQESFWMRHAWKIGLACWAVLIADFIVNVLPAPVFGLTALLGTLFLIPAIVVWLERLVRASLGLVYGPAGRLGSRNVQRNKGRVTLAAGVLAVGVIMMIVVGAMTEGLRKTLDEWAESALGGDFYIRSSYGSIRADMAREIARVEGVESVTPMTVLPVKAVGAATAKGYKPRLQGILLRAIDPATYKTVTFLRFAEDEERRDEIFAQFAQGGTVLVTPSVKQTFGVQRGDKLRLRTARGEHDFVVAGVVVDMYAGGQVAIFSRDDLRDYFNDTRVTYFAVKREPNTSPAALQTRLEELGKRRYMTILPTQTFRQQMREQYDNMIMLLNLVVAIIIVIASLGVMNTMSTTILERVQEFGMLRSVGMTDLQVGKMVLGEAAAIGAIGAFLGLAAGVVVSYMMVIGLNQGQGWQMDYIFPALPVVLGLAVALIVSQVASLYSARRAMRLNAVEAMRYE
jgi:putative ABC transport system permease protein